MHTKDKATNTIRGKIGEDAVANYLVDQGFSIVARNFRQMYGEVDIVAQKNEILAFIEVKLRSSFAIDPAELIGVHKQKKIIAVAKSFLSHHTYTDVVCRFDVALVAYQGGRCFIQYIHDAFADFD